MPITDRLAFRLILGGSAVAAVFAAWHFTRTPDSAPRAADDTPPDPRVAADTPFRNVRPGVEYVGDARCAACHHDICDSYHDHPMGRSAAYLADSVPLEKFGPAGRAAFTSGAFDFAAELTPKGMSHRIHFREPSPAPVADADVLVQLAIGSGTRGRSYLSLDHGRVWQSPMSWFGPEEHWDVSPGFRGGHTVRRAITPECLFCHVDRVEPVRGTENRYREPILSRQAAVGCERCHGPGGLHVAERADGSDTATPDTSIVNPRHLDSSLQLAVCEQCHLQGEERVNRREREPFEFRPGLRFEDFVSVFVRHPEAAIPNKSVGQFEQMEQSRCFTESGGRLNCATCHDPHAAPAPAAKAKHYRSRCQSCHDAPGAIGCVLPESARHAKQNDCTACHMPKGASANIAHASVTDHRVPRANAPRLTPRGIPFGESPLVRFRGGAHLPPDELERDLGIALARFARKDTPLVGDRGVVRSAGIERLTRALKKWPGDAEAWDTLAGAYPGRAEVAEKLRAATKAVEFAPESETALLTLTEAATSANVLDLALETASKLARSNPTASGPLVARAFVYLKRGEWSAAEADCHAALRIQPLHPETRLYLAICLHQLGDPAAGSRESRTAAQLESDSRERDALLDWYRRATR